MNNPQLSPTLPEIGAELRSVVKHLDTVAAHVRVCSTMLEATGADTDPDAGVVLRVSVATSLYSQTQRLARLASRCDGLPVDAEYADENDESDTEGDSP